MEPAPRPHSSAQIGIVIPTLNAGGEIEKCLGPIVRSPHFARYRILVVDSSSTDDTVERAKQMGIECEVIPRSEFDHGLTRNRARKKLNTPVVVCMTQDAYPTSPDTIEHLVAPLFAGTAQASYGRQIPRPGCDFVEAYAREFSYGPDSFVKSWEDRATFGIRLFMCSNSFAAYDNAALEKVGGFPETVFGEDFLAAKALIKSGGKIAYCAEAAVEHSHAYRLRAEMKRNYQIGLMHTFHPEIFDGLPKTESAGMNFARGLLRRAREAAGFAGVSKALVYLVARLSSYKWGRLAARFSRSRKLPG